MPKFVISNVEWYPVLMLEPPSKENEGETSFEISADLVRRYEAALAEWESVQAALRAIEEKERTPRA